MSASPSQPRMPVASHTDGLIGGDDLLMPSEVAALAGVSPKTVARWASEGKLPALRTLGGHRRFRRSVVEELLGRARLS